MWHETGLGTVSMQQCDGPPRAHLFARAQSDPSLPVWGWRKCYGQLAGLYAATFGRTGT